MSGVLWLLAQQLMSAAQTTKKRFNPQPPGSVMPGSVTDVVLNCVRGHGTRFLTRAQIVDMTGAPPKSVDWALHVLRKAGYIESRTHRDSRSSLYLIYRTKTKK